MDRLPWIRLARASLVVLWPLPLSFGVSAGFVSWVPLASSFPVLCFRRFGTVSCLAACAWSCSAALWSAVWFAACVARSVSSPCEGLVWVGVAYSASSSPRRVCVAARRPRSVVCPFSSCRSAARSSCHLLCCARAAAFVRGRALLRPRGGSLCSVGLRSPGRVLSSRGGFNRGCLDSDRAR